MNRAQANLDASLVSGRPFGAALFLASISGAAALAHELLWSRRLIDLLGASGESTARVFGCFFLGLALGSASISQVATRIIRPWRAAALAEAMVAVLALPALFLNDFTGWIWPALGPEGLLGPAGAAVKLLISFGVIVPPSFAMGTTLPLLAAAALDESEAQTLDRQEIGLYAANTLGGVAGLAATCLIGLPALGASGSMVLAIAINLALAGVLMWLDRSSATIKGTRAKGGSPPAAGIDVDAGPILPGVVAFVSGMGVLAAEILCLELMMLVAPLSFYAPAALLATLIFLLGIAAMLTPGALRRHGGATRLLPSLFAVTAIAMTATPILFMMVVAVFGNLNGAQDLAEFLARLVLLVMVIIGPSMFLAGFVFPVSLAWAQGEGSAGRARELGRLLALNGLGGLIGAEGAYRLILPTCGIHGGLAVVGLLYGLVGLGLALAVRKRDAAARSRPGTLLSTLTLPMSAIVVALGLAIVWVRHLPHVNPHLGFTILDERFGREGAVAVVEGERIGRAILLSNQYTLGSTSVRWDQERQAHLPLLLHPNPRQVAFLGMATGITPGAALDHESVDSITAIELSSLVARAADRFFGAFNHALTRNRRARVVIEDARTYLAASPGRFDVVVGDLFLPWAPGEGRLFSVEHFLSVRRSLRPGGVYCQWLPMYQLTPEHFELVAASFQRAFPKVRMLRNGFGVRQPMLGLVGFRDADLDWETVSRRCEEARRGGAVVDPTARHPEAIRMLDLGLWRPGGDPTEINTLGNLRLELDAGRERLTGNPGRKYIHRDRWLQIVQHSLATARTRSGTTAEDRADPDRSRTLELMQLGFDLSVWELSRLHDQRRASFDREDFPAGILRRMPAGLVADASADWARWPGAAPRSSRGPRPLGGLMTPEGPHPEMTGMIKAERPK